MSQRPMPLYIDPVKLVEQKSMLTGQLKLEDMPRLLKCVSVDHLGLSGDAEIKASEFQLGKADNTIDVDLDFYRDEQGLRVVAGRVSCRLGLVCQRCLGVKILDLDIPVALAIVANEEAVSHLPERYEALIMTNEPLHLVTLIEDELLLALPTVAYHDEGECSLQGYINAEEDEIQLKTESTPDSTGKKTSPFDVLADLKK